MALCYLLPSLEDVRTRNLFFVLGLDKCCVYEHEERASTCLMTKTLILSISTHCHLVRFFLVHTGLHYEVLLRSNFKSMLPTMDHVFFH